MLGVREWIKDPELTAIAGLQILVVGAGGIGCELLKNLVLTGFTDITVVRAFSFACVP